MNKIIIIITFFDSSHPKEMSTLLSGYVLTIDIETSGPSTVIHDLLAYGAVVMRISDKEIMSRLKVYIKPRGGSIRWDHDTEEFWNKNMKVKTEMLAGIEREGKMRHEAARALFEWVKAFGEDINKKNTVVTDTAGFDVEFMNLLLTESGYPAIKLIFGEYRPIFDSTSYHRGVGGMLYSDGPWGSDASACKTLGLPDLEKQCPFPSDHDPINDASSIAWVHVSIMHEVARKRGAEEEANNTGNKKAKV